MTDPRIGRLTLGQIPRVVGTITTHATLASILPLQPRLCDLIEVRLDLTGWEHADWLHRCQAIEVAGTPVILTLRAAFEGGQWDGADPERLKIIERAIDALATVDVEQGSTIRDAVCALARDRGKPVIVSFHDFEKTPPLAELMERLRDMRAQPNAIPKLATMVRNAADLETLRAFLKQGLQGGALCVIGMGAQGVDSRASFPALGSCLTYGFIDASSAPGQWPADQLFARVHSGS